MLETPTPPEGYRLAERGKTYRYDWNAHPSQPLNLMWDINRLCWEHVGSILPHHWRDWPGGIPTHYAIPLEKQDV